jgi:hypothetical protein
MLYVAVWSPARWAFELSDDDVDSSLYTTPYATVSSISIESPSDTPSPGWKGACPGSEGTEYPMDARPRSAPCGGTRGIGPPRATVKSMVISSSVPSVVPSMLMSESESEPDSESSPAQRCGTMPPPITVSSMSISPSASIPSLELSGAGGGMGVVGRMAWTCARMSSESSALEA